MSDPRTSASPSTAAHRIVTIGRKTAGILTQAESRSLRRRLFWAAIGVALIGTLIAGIGNYLSATRTPAEAVEKYLTQLHQGSYYKTIDRSAYTDRSKVFLTNSIYRESPARVEDFSVEKITEIGDQATVETQVSLAGKTENVSFDLVKDHKAGIFNDTWRLAQPGEKMQTMSNDFYLDRISVNGSTVKLKEAETKKKDDLVIWDMALLPGIFTLDLPADSYYSLVGGPQKIQLGIAQDQLDPVQLKVRPSYRMWSETDQAIKDWLQECLGSSSLGSAGCPSVKEPAEGRITQVKWALKDRPIMYLEEGESQPGIWRASKYKPATFTVTYRLDGEERRETIEADIEATVISSGSDVSIEVSAGEQKVSSPSPSAKGTDRSKNSQ